jgi:ribonuclease D
MIINSQKKLDIFKKYFNKKNFLCVDTEFERKKTYYSKLSIVTISDGVKFFIFDVLQYPNHIEFLKKIFKSKKKIKIIHGGNQDIEIFLDKKINIEPYFDTQLAAGFLGLDRNISYANLVKKYLNKKIDKTNQNQDWLKRPINKSQINYLKKDVLYLKQIYLVQTKQLKKNKKLNFAKEEFDLILNKIKNNNGINSKFKKKLGNQIYKNQNFLKLIKLRDKKSQKENLPKNWVIKDEDIISMIKNKKYHSLKKNNFFTNKEKVILIKLLKNISSIEIKKNYNEIDIKALEFFRYLVSKKYSIDSNLIASKYDLIDYKYIKNKSKWRFKIFYNTFDKIIKGEKKFLLNSFKKLN